MEPTTESRLIAQVHSGNTTAYQAFVTGHLGMVYELATRHMNGGGARAYEELVGEGRLALCEAAQKFPARHLKCRFSTYAHTRINAAMVSWRRTDGQMGGTEWTARRSKAARQGYEALTQFLVGENDPIPTAEDFAFVAGEAEANALNSGVTYVEVDEQLEAPPTVKYFPWESLPPVTRVVLDEMLRLQAVTGNLTLAPVQEALHISRDELLQRLYQAHALLEAAE